MSAKLSRIEAQSIPDGLESKIAMGRLASPQPLFPLPTISGG